MKSFFSEEFLLKNEIARKLYENYAKTVPIIDYHCHLSAEEIANDRKYENITQVWLEGDHYKWRLMRANGIEEQYITGKASDYDKFIKWAETIEYAIGNPLYHWTVLELKRYFKVEVLLTKENADTIWKHCNKIIKSGEFSARKLIQNSKVELICTTDDPIDTLYWHKKLAETPDFNVKVLPTFRPDNAMKIYLPTFVSWIEKLESVCEMRISTLEELCLALRSRMEYFKKYGCIISDHGLDSVPNFIWNEELAKSAFEKRILGHEISVEECEAYQTYLFNFFGTFYGENGWVMQLHIGAMRNNNKIKFKQLGADSGYDSISDNNFGESLSHHLNALEEIKSLSKTIIYTLNPNKNSILSTLAGCFYGEGIRSKIQFGTAWWFNDHIEGMRDQMKSLASLGYFANFIGMLTDSRSFLSYTRHEYFRRILCQLVSEWAEGDEIPRDVEYLGKIIENISYYNAKYYFNI